MQKQKNRFSLVDCAVLTLIVLIAIAFRLYKINTPLADLHSWRQADTSAVSRNYARNGINLLKPQFDDLSSNQSGLENPQGLRYVEFPIYNAITAIVYRFYPPVPIEIYGRLVTVFFSLIIIAVIYYLCLAEKSRLCAIAASFVYAVFPFFVFMSRVVLPETTALAFAFLALLCLYLYFDKKNAVAKTFLFSAAIVCYAVSVLVKPPAVFYGIAMLYLFFKEYRLRAFKKVHFYALFILSAIPFILWRVFISQFPQGIPPNDWLITSVNTYQGLKNIFFKPAFFRWVFFERLNIAILGGYLSVFLLLGLFAKQTRYFLHFIFLSALTYLFVFQGGNVQHEYYQTLILPAVAIAVGMGVSFLLQNRKLFIHPLFTYGVTLILFGLSFFFSFYTVRDYYNTPSDLPQIARIVDSLTNPADKIVTDRSGDTTLLYLMDRKGAPSIYKSPDELQKLGYNYLVTANQGLIQEMKSKYKFPAVFENSNFSLFRL